MIAQTVRDSVDEVDTTRGCVTSATCYPRRPFISNELLFWRTAHEVMNGVDIAGSDVPPRGAGITEYDYVTGTSTHEHTREVRYIMNTDLVETTGDDVVGDQRGVEGTVDITDTVRIDRVPTPMPAPSRRRHLRTRFSRRRRLTDETVIKMTLIIFVSVCWPMFGVTVWLMNT